MTLTVEDIATIQRIGRDEENQRTSIGLTELDALCAAARAGVRLADMLRGFVGPGAEMSLDPRVVDALRNLLRVAGFEP